MFPVLTLALESVLTVFQIVLWEIAHRSSGRSWPSVRLTRLQNNKAWRMIIAIEAVDLL